MSKKLGNKVQKLGFGVAVVGGVLFLAGAISIGALPTGLNGPDVPLGLLAFVIIIAGLAIVLVGSWIGGEWLRM